MKRAYILFILMNISFSLFSNVEKSELISMNDVYNQDFEKKANKVQKEAMQYAMHHQDQKLRVMTYNMLYNAKDAEDKLLPKHRWDCRKPRLIEYLTFAQADIICSQELQEDQVQEVIDGLGSNYGCYGEKTRQNEGRSDTNAIFFNKNRVELIGAKTISYNDDHYENAFTCCYFRDKLLDKTFIVTNTKLTWGNVERRLAEATQLNQFASHESQKEPVILLGDFNTYPCIQHKRNLFLDGWHIEKVLAGKNFQDAKQKSIFGHYGPFCSITNSETTLEPFVGPKLTGFILDHIFVNEWVDVFTHGIDTAKVNGEFPSDHFPVIADIYFK
jgi:endonuclease/exonuclease/phosphatase family metal-dependent hydrolase